MASRLRRSSAQSASSFASPSSSTASISSPRKALTNSKSLPDANEKALLEILVGSEVEREPHFARPCQTYDQNPDLFGPKGSDFRVKVHKRLKYLEKSRIKKGSLFYTRCLELGVQSPAESRPAVPTTVDFFASELDSSQSGSMTDRFGPGKIC
jgi:hypothetical protein